MTQEQGFSEKSSIEWLGGKYKGEMKNNLPHGSGKFLLPNGAGYSGEWQMGKPHGPGVMRYADGAFYRGDFYNGKPHGYGIYSSPGGRKKAGFWKNGQFAGAADEPARTAEKSPSYADKRPAAAEHYGEPAINVQNLSYWYNNLQAVKEISFQVKPGEILGFLGPNGAGKSTTIKVLTGQLALQEGAAQILGRDIGREDPLLQAQIGVTFEEKNLYQEMTALENLDFFASLFGLRQVDNMAALRRVGLADRARDRVSNYSKGMRQRLMIARAFINRPKVLFLDEPTDGLDPVTAAEIRKTIREEAQRGASVLLTTHNMFEADELSDRVAFINEGEIVALDTAENLKLKYGKRSVLVRLREGEKVREINLPLEGGKASARLGELAASPNLLTIHTEEATLEAIFIRLTGRGLAG